MPETPRERHVGQLECRGLPAGPTRLDRSLWKAEGELGQVEGRKDRPCATVLAFDHPDAERGEARVDYEGGPTSGT